MPGWRQPVRPWARHAREFRLRVCWPVGAQAGGAYVRRAAPEVLATAAAQRWEPAEVLRVLLAEEAAGCDRATIAVMLRRTAPTTPSAARSAG